MLTCWRTPFRKPFLKNTLLWSAVILIPYYSRTSILIWNDVKGFQHGEVINVWRNKYIQHESH